MKFTCSVKINLSKNDVARLWENESNFKNWQDGFESIELFEGEKGKVGAKSKLVLQQGKKKIELIETILENNLPEIRKALYEHIHMVNTQVIRIEQSNENESLLTSEIEYTKFNGFMPRMMALLFPGIFKKQTQKWLNQFKAFVEMKK